MPKNINPESKMGRNAFSTVASASFGIVATVVLDAIVIAMFGMRRQTDAYYIAFTIPAAIITVMMLQATRVVQPVFIAKRTSGDAAGWNYLNLVMTTGTVVVGAFCLVGVAFSHMLMNLQSAGSPEETVLATRFSILFFLILPMYFPIVVMRAALNGLDVFAVPGAMKFFESTFRIIFVLLLGHRMGLQALVLGTFAGAMWQIGVFYYFLKRHGYRFRPSFGLKHPDMVQAYSLTGFQLTGQVCSAGVDVVNNTLGSMLGAGSVTALRLAGRIIDSFASLLPASIIFAAMPAVSASVARGDKEATKKHLQRGFYLLLLVSIPLCVWLGLVNRQLIAFLYQRMDFSASDTILVSNLLLLMVPYLFLSRMRSLFELPFFGEQNTRTPLLGSVTESVTYVLTSLALVSHFGIYALPVGRAVSCIISSSFLGYLLQRRMGSLELGKVRKPTSKVVLASGVMAVFILLGAWLAPAIPVTGFATRVVALGLPSGTAVLSIFAALFALGTLDASMLGDYGLNLRFLTRLQDLRLSLKQRNS
jgi:putative peptidoglycan lipid II flippase